MTEPPLPKAATRLLRKTIVFGVRGLAAPPTEGATVGAEVQPGMRVGAWAPGLIVLFAGALYLGTLRYGFVWDDLFLISPLPRVSLRAGGVGRAGEGATLVRPVGGDPLDRGGEVVRGEGQP